MGRTGYIIALMATAGVVYPPALEARCVRWPSGTEVNVYLNRQSFTDRGFSSVAVEYLVRAAIDEWSTSGRANIRLRYAGLRNYAVSTSGALCSNTGQDVIIQMNPGTSTGGCDGGTLAVAQCDDDTSPAPCCVRVWEGAGCTWNWTEGWPESGGGGNTYSLWDTITHELGHVLCLPHSDEFGDPPLGDAPEDDANAVMFSEAQTTTTQRFLKPHDVFRLLAPRTDPVTLETLEYGDRTDNAIVHRYDAEGDAMAGSLQDFDFPGDPQDGVALDIEGATWVAAWSDADDGSYLKYSESDDGVEWDAPGNIGGARSIQVPAIATNGSKHVVAYLSGYAQGGASPGWGGTGRSIYVRRYPVNNTWSSSVLIGSSFSGPALAYYGSGCFVIAYVTTDSSCPDCIRTKVSCDYGATWASQYTDDVRSTERPAIAWGSSGAWGGILWTTNVLDDGSAWGNHVRHGRLGNGFGVFYVDSSPLEAIWRYTSNFPALTVSDAAAPQANRYVRIIRNTGEGPPGSGRQISSGYLDDMSTNAWTGWCCSGDSYSPPAAAYSWVYDEFWAMFDQ